MVVENETLEFYREYIKNKWKGKLVPSYEEVEGNTIWNYFEITDPNVISFIRLVPDSSGSLLWELFLTGKGTWIRNGAELYEAYLNATDPESKKLGDEIIRFFGAVNGDEEAKKRAFGEYCKLFAQSILVFMGIPVKFTVRGILGLVYETLVRSIDAGNGRVKWRVINPADLDNVDFVNWNIYSATVTDIILRNPDDVKVFIDNYTEFIRESFKNAPRYDKVIEGLAKLKGLKPEDLMKDEDQRKRLSSLAGPWNK